MEQQLQPSLWERTTTHRFLTWLLSARTLRRGLITLAWIVSLVALCYGVIDWRSRHAWNEYRRNYEAHVASLELTAYIPKPIPDSENFAATPVADAWIKRFRDTNSLFSQDAWSRASDMVDSRPKLSPGGHFEKEYADLAAWQKAFAAAGSHERKPKDGFRTEQQDLPSRAQAAPAVLAGLRDDEEALEELRTASARPDSRFPIVYDMENPWAILLPHLAKIKGTCQRLKIRACAELALGQNEKALDDIKLILYLADTVKSEPFVISHLVLIADVQIGLQPIWEGLAEHRWTDAQLEQLQTRLEAFDFVADMQRPLHAERAAGAVFVDFLKKKGLSAAVDLMGNSPATVPDWGKAVAHALSRIAPSGWYDQEKLHFCQHFDNEFLGSVDDTSKRVFPDKVAANAAACVSLDKGHEQWHILMRHEFVAALMLPSLAKLPLKAAVAQTGTDQAAVACALERYRLANGQFPENLQALAPRFMPHLPNDVITGEPFKYRRIDNGRFVLYSVGWNEKDDGGTPGKTMFDETQGDWVW